jgi:hypothetical protein
MVMDGYGLFLFGVFIIFEFVFIILGLTPAVPEMPNVQSRSEQVLLIWRQPQQHIILQNYCQRLRPVGVATS